MALAFHGLVPNHDFRLAFDRLVDLGDHSGSDIPRVAGDRRVYRADGSCVGELDLQG